MTERRAGTNNVTEKIRDEIYQIKVPLPDNPLKALNSYLITGGKRNLLIDTGFFHPVCLDTMLEGFREIEAKVSDTDIFLTHLHADHSGLASELAGSDTKVYCSKPDGRIINLFSSEAYWDEMSDFFAKHGMPDIQEDQAQGIHPGKLFGGRGKIKFQTVVDGDIIAAGKYHLHCICTPGHTPGHMCLFEEKEKLLFSGDHVLGDITPVISPEKGMERPLKQYLESLERVARLEVREILPGHRGRIAKPYERIEALKKHHRLRLEEICNILKQARCPVNAYEAASKMKWKMPKEIWEKVPRQQRWFATGEAIAHLLYLEEEGFAVSRINDGSIAFSLNEKGGEKIR